MARRWFTPFRSVAIIAARNESFTLGRCLQHLAEQDMQACIIDNDADDATAAIIERFTPSVVIRREHHPHPGYFDWEGLLRRKAQVGVELDADWVMHLDADEIPESPFPGLTLRDAFRRVTRQGYNAVNFHEFVFVPASPDENWAGRDYVAGMKQYYFFEPHPLRLVRAWRNGATPVQLAESGGHDATFAGRRIFPQAFVLRHYIALSLQQLRTKYGNRTYAPQELARGWHHNRIGIGEADVILPDPASLHHYGDDGKWDTSRPRSRHFFERSP